MPKTCRTKCVEGCRCPEGQALDENNECIPITMCPCAYKGLNFNAGYKEVRPGTKHVDLWYNIFYFTNEKTFHVVNNITYEVIIYIKSLPLTLVI